MINGCLKNKAKTNKKLITLLVCLYLKMQPARWKVGFIYLFIIVIIFLFMQKFFDSVLEVMIGP